MTTNRIPALVLAAGLGTRLHPLTLVRAKPAMPVAGDALICRIIRSLVRQGVSDLVVNLHHLPETLTAIVGDGSELGGRVRYSWEQPAVLGSAGGPRHALPLLQGGTFFVVNGDTLTDVDFARLAAAHTETGALVTLALARNHDAGRYGGVRLDAGGRVIGFAPRGSAEGSFHFLGVQIASAETFRSVPDDTPVNSIGGVYDQLISSRPGSIRGVVFEAQFWDVGTLSDYWTTCTRFADQPKSSDNMHGERVCIEESARVTRSILWDDIVVGEGAIVDECIVTDGVRIPPGSTYRRAALVKPPDGNTLLVTPF